MASKHFAVPLTILLALFLPLAAQADGFEAGFGVGAIEFDDELGGETEVRFDGRFGYNVTHAFEIEAQVIHATSILSLDLDAYMVNGIWNFHFNKKIVTYVLGGIGSATVEFSPLFGENVDDDGFAYQVASGVRFFFNESQRFAFRLELSALGEETFGESSIHKTLAAGLTWRFGD